MVKLITQFDNEKTKLSLATPTCGACCCCCCCCCIVSTFATASISARNFGSYVEEKLPNEPEKIKHARRIGFWLPLGLLINLGIALWFIYAFELDTFIAIITLIAIGILYLFVETYALKEKLNLPGITGEVIKSFVLLVTLEIAGFAAGMFILIQINQFKWLYLIGAIVISILLIRWAFEKKYLSEKDDEK